MTLRKYGATISGESGTEGNGFKLYNKSARSPSPELELEK